MGRAVPRNRPKLTFSHYSVKTRSKTMVLGILVSTDRHPDDVIGLARAALSRGHRVIIFVMDTGTRILSLPSFSGLSASEGVTTGFCDYNAKALNIPADHLPPTMSRGSQYDNAVMVNTADRVIVL